MKGTSKTKFCKGTDIPKHSGNFSPIRMHWQSRTYYIEQKDGALLIGNGTPANKVLPEPLIWLMLHDPNFKSYEQRGTHTRNGKKYTSFRLIHKKYTSMSGFVMTEQIDTEGDFDYNFKNY